MMNVVLLPYAGNGTLSKQAGIDYKQLSLLTTISKNQSEEVSCSLALLLMRAHL